MYELVAKASAHLRARVGNGPFEGSYCLKADFLIYHLCKTEVNKDISVEIWTVYDIVWLNISVDYL